MQILITSNKSDARIFSRSECNEILVDLNSSSTRMIPDAILIADSRYFITLSEFSTKRLVGYYVNHTYSSNDIETGDDN